MNYLNLYSREHHPADYFNSFVIPIAFHHSCNFSSFLRKWESVISKVLQLTVWLYSFVCSFCSGILACAGMDGLYCFCCLRSLPLILRLVIPRVRGSDGIGLPFQPQRFHIAVLLRSSIPACAGMTADRLLFFRIPAPRTIIPTKQKPKSWNFGPVIPTEVGMQYLLLSVACLHTSRFWIFYIYVCAWMTADRFLFLLVICHGFPSYPVILYCSPMAVIPTKVESRISDFQIILWILLLFWF